MKHKFQIASKFISVISILSIIAVLIPKISFGEEDTEESNNVPEFYGTTDITIRVGDILDLNCSFYRIYAKDFEDGNITKNIKITKNTVKTRPSG